MRILYLSQYFPPEAGATQTRAYEMASNWSRMGHSVTMLTEFPNHPSGVIPPQYNGRLFERELWQGMEIMRVWVKASPIKNFRNRMLFYLSYMVNAIISGLLLAKGKYDFIYATSPPLFVGAAALVISYLRRIPLVFEIRDLWPESAIALGELTNPGAIAMSAWLEERCYQRAVQLVVVTQGIRTKLITRGISPEKMIIIPNGANTDMFRFLISERQHLRQELNLEQKFVAIYAGIHGLAQGLETILEAARLLQSSSEIHFLMIGDGPKKEELLSKAGQYNLSNLTLLPEKARELMPSYLSAADIALIPLRKMEIFKGALPSKIFDAWACERPVLISIAGEAREVVESVHGGIFISPESPEEMANALLELKNRLDELNTMGKNGREYTVQTHSRKALAEKLITHLEKVVEY